MASINGAGGVTKRIKGLVMPIPTVFDGQGEVDFPGMEQLTDWYVESGVHAFFVLGSQGQGPACRIDQRKDVAELVVKRVNGRVPVIIQVGAVDPYTSVELAGHAKKIGADSIGMVGPYYYNDRSEWELIEQHRMADAAAGLPMLLYNNPAYSGYPTTPAMMANLREAVPNVFGAKLAAGSTDHAIPYLRTLGRDFNIFIPLQHMLPGMQVGVSGSIAPSVVATPEIGVQFIEAIWAQEFEKARQIQLTLVQHSERMAPLRKYGRLVTQVALQLRGIPVKQYPRWPTQPMTSEDMDLMRKNMELLGALAAVPA